MTICSMPPVFRFAPSPNGALHLGHALSALINFEAAKAMGGRFLLRIEDIDTVRCSPEKIAAMLEDLEWLGLEWESPVMRQSERFALYRATTDRLTKEGLIFPSTASRKDIARAVEEAEAASDLPWPRDPDGAPVYPRAYLADKEINGPETALRLDMEKAMTRLSEPLTWQENGPLSPGYPAITRLDATPAAWGDVILARKDCPTSYHLAVVLDDAAQGITHVVRGQDLFAATSLHRLLQHLLALPAPLYHHHRLLTDEGGDKLSKSRGDLGLSTLRARGTTPDEIRAMIRLSEKDLAAFAQ